MARTRKSKVESGNGKGERLRFFLTPDLRPLAPSRGISLIEVLISMFVLLFGLMGVAAIFPVASHYIQEGDKRDRSSGLAQIAFEELKSKKLLKPNQWTYLAQTTDTGTALPVLAPPSLPPVMFFEGMGSAGCAFVIDPLAGPAPGASADSTRAASQFFPRSSAAYPPNPWTGWQIRVDGGPFIVTNWPVRRVTFAARPGSAPFSNPTLSKASLEQTFTLRDELVTQQPEAGDRPSVQLWRRNNNGTPNDPTDDQMLSRQFNGNYTWLATVVPTRNTALLGMQPSAGIRDEFYEVTSVVFYKRDITPSATVGSSAGSERLISAEFLNNGELALYNDGSLVDTVDTALDGVKPTNWIAVCGVNQITGAFMLKWYKILAMDDSSDGIDLNNTSVSNPYGRYLMVDGPEWPEGRNAGGVAVGWQNLRAIILPGAIDAYTRVMQLEQE